MLDCHQHRAAPFAADADALEDAEEKQHGRGQNADRSISRQQADQERCDSHNEDRENQHGFAADTITVMAENDAAERSRYEADEERCVGEQSADQRIVVGKEKFVEHEWSHHTEQKKVIPFDGCADGAGQCNRADRGPEASRLCVCQHFRPPLFVSQICPPSSSSHYNARAADGGRCGVGPRCIRSRASSGVAISRPSSRTMRAARSTSCALLTASTPWLK